ncbi:MAG: hypothetical protein AAF481_04435 [Acidobacteriota bacterium]
MGFLNRLFRKDPAAALANAEELLSRGNLLRARQIAEGIQAGSDPYLRERATDLARRARMAMLEGTLDRAAEAEKNGDLVEAGDWLRSALEHAVGSAREEEVRQRLASIARRQASANTHEAYASSAARGSGGSDPFGGSGGRTPKPRSFDPEDHAEVFEGGEFDGSADDETLYATFIDMLSPAVAGRYDDRPRPFRRALVHLNEGRFAEASAGFEDLVAADPGDPVLRLERGRCRLATGEAAGAREDFDIAWETFGDTPLDRAGDLSVPRLWTEAALEAGDSEAVVERLADPLLENPANSGPELAELFGVALLNLERLDEARDFLAAAAQQYPRTPAFPYLLARALEALELKDQAVACLETAIAPSCASGNCSKPPLHLPSTRALARLYLDQEPPNLARADQLLGLIYGARKGHFKATDLRLIARHRELSGDQEGAEEARRAAEDLQPTMA